MFMTTDAPAADPTGVLFAWFSPAFPTGGFGYSHGIESAVADGWIAGEAGLGDWLQAIAAQGSGWTDAVLFAMAWRAARAGDDRELLNAAALSSALAPSRERLAESEGQGQAFLAAVREGWPEAAPHRLPQRVTYAVAAGACCGRLGAPGVRALEAFLTGVCANLIAAGVRLGLCGQSGGVRILSGLAPPIAALAVRAAEAGEDDLGSCALMSDVASMRHELMDGRLFLS
jgi:urease accessory protein